MTDTTSVGRNANRARRAAATGVALLSSALWCMSVVAGEAASAATWRLALSPHTEHYHRSEDHRRVWLAGLERENAEGRLMGAGYFKNSFGQPSWYFYPWGASYGNLLGVRPLYVKWSAGVIYGYRAPFEDKVPLNVGGFTPVVVPAIGWDFGNGFSAQMNAIGTAAVMFQLSIDVTGITRGRH